MKEQIEEQVSQENFDEAKEAYTQLIKLNGITQTQDYYNFARLLVLDDEPDYTFIIRNIKTALLKDGKINLEFFVDANLNALKEQPA